MGIVSPHRDCRTHYISRTHVYGQGPDRKWRRHRGFPKNREKDNVNMIFVKFSSLSLIALCVSVVLYLHVTNGPEPAMNPNAKGVTGELVLCIASCHGASRDVALVRRGRPGSTDAEEVRAASYALPWPRSYPKELRGWPNEPFAGPFVALVSTQPKNKDRRELIRKNLAQPSLYPPGSFRLIFFVRAPGPGANMSYFLGKSLLDESNKHGDMLIDAYALSTLRAAILEWAPAFANASRLLLWARDDAAFEASSLLDRMESLVDEPGDVFGRVSALDNRDMAFSENAKFK
ncbi:hypothetical protein HPB52_013766 [Rhipicephalus sanguineus]|uniref:Hexosyltransferase n=1 Tax=Rhipicephalus sanguineus TaxID=34632 RepID=A0A9D4PP64_RHISA|nr:hypothetical protein HPB52_013766 [Rhipicephalus sanguineus]